MLKSTQIKDPHERDTWTWDWSLRLASGETIATAQIHAVAAAADDTSPLVVESSAITAGTAGAGTAVTAWVSGGTAGAAYGATCHVTTTTGRVLEKTMPFRVMER